MKHEQREPALREPPPCEWGGTSAAYLMGSVSGTALHSFLQHLDGGCIACRTEVDQDRETLAYLDATELWNDTTLQQPPSSTYDTIRDTIRARVAGTVESGSPIQATSIQTWKNWSAKSGSALGSGLVTLRSNEGDWQPIGVEGIRVRQLAVDPARRLVTMLVRMESGACYPPHRHAAAEECYVLEGELHVEDGSRGREELLRAGDFQRAEAGSLHGRQWTERGCTLLIVSSQDDELVA